MERGQVGDEEPQYVDGTPVLRQRIATDILPEKHDYWHDLDLTPPSADVGAILQGESNARLKPLTPLMPWIEVYSVLTSDIMTRVMYHNLKEQNPDAADDTLKRWFDSTSAQNLEIVRGSLYPVLAALLDSGHLVLGDV